MDLSDPGIALGFSCIAGGFFTNWAIRRKKEWSKRFCARDQYYGKVRGTIRLPTRLKKAWVTSSGGRSSEVTSTWQKSEYVHLFTWGYNRASWRRKSRPPNLSFLGVTLAHLEGQTHSQLKRHQHPPVPSNSHQKYLKGISEDCRTTSKRNDEWFGWKHSSSGKL